MNKASIGRIVIVRTPSKFNGSNEHPGIITCAHNAGYANVKVLPDCGAPYDETSLSIYQTREEGEKSCSPERFGFWPTRESTAPAPSLVAPAVAMVLLAILFLSGCSTVNGKRQVDPVKVSQARAIIEPVAAGAIRRVILNSPEHAPEIARYAAAVAGVFCTMSLSNEFAPEFLVTQLDRFADPELAKISDGYLIDVKNAGVGVYKLLWGDRLRAEIPATNWLHAVCELFCESISQGLSDAGYPGGVPQIKSKITSTSKSTEFLYTKKAKGRTRPTADSTESLDSCGLGTHRPLAIAEGWRLARDANRCASGLPSRRSPHFLYGDHVVVLSAVRAGGRARAEALEGICET